MFFVRTFSPVSLFILLLGVVGVGILTAGGDWSFNHGVVFAGAGLLMVLFSPVGALPKSWSLLAVGFVLSLGLAFLPDGIFPSLSWRSGLEEAGLGTGSGVAIQRQVALEAGGVFVLTLLVGLWLLGQRISAEGLRLVAFMFSLGVAAYALVSFSHREPSVDPGLPAHFGFFPNRNHTATLLAMGVITALGSLMQAIRDRHAWTIGISLVALAICAWAVIDWSVSRAGVLLVGVGAVIWLAALGPGYLHGHARKALLLLGVAAVGGFLAVDSPVKERIVRTVEKAGGVEGGVDGAPVADDGKGLDFRVPTWQDTLGMIRDRPWTGFGAGQFGFVFPQYRDRTAVAGETRTVHPESDWLWLVAEAGIPAGLLAAALVLAAVTSAWRGLSGGRSRAIRAGCLAAALVLGIHGLFDVPGHRVPLFWSAALLLALSRRPAAAEIRATGRWLSRAGGLVVLAAGVWLLAGPRMGLREPVTPQGDQAVAVVEELYKKDQIGRSDLKKPPVPPGEPVEDPLVAALGVLEGARGIFPLDHRLHRLEGLVAMEFAGRKNQAQQAFGIERLLEPVQPTLSLGQAAAWAPVDPAKALEAAADARVRASRLDGRKIAPPHGSDRWSSMADHRISELVRKYPALKAEP
jgi:O-antigen ligase